MRIKVVEQAGTSLKRMLQSSDPFEKQPCGQDCFVCRSNGIGHCKKASIKYSIKCDAPECNNIYHGESSKNGYCRGKEHESDYRNHLERSHMWKHCVLKHDSEEQSFAISIDKTFRRDPLLRQITEAIAIQDTPEENRMNSRSEWSQQSIPRIIINT